MTRTSTIKGKQSVHYRHISDEGLDVLVNLPRAAGTLLIQIVKDADKKDNCCQLSPRQLIEKLELNHSNAYTQIRKLKSVNFLRDVEDVSGATRLMVNPAWMAWQSLDLVRFTILMYSLGSHDLAIKHLNLEEQCRGKIDINTGEHFDWYKAGLERANEHHDLKSTNSYDYITTVKLPYLNTSQTAQLSTTSNSMKNSKVANTYLQPVKQSTYQKDDSREECDDYDGSCSYRRTRPAILRFKDVISLID